MLDQFELRGAIPDRCDHLVRMVGTGASAPTKVYGPGVTITRTGVGAYTLTWADNPGAFLGHTEGFQATTHADLKAFTVVAGVFNTTTFSLAIVVYNGSAAAADLAALQWLTLNLSFSPSGVIPG